MIASNVTTIDISYIVRKQQIFITRYNLCDVFPRLLILKTLT